MVFEPKLTVDQRSAIVGSTDSAKELADAYGVTTQTVYNIRQQARDEAKRMEIEAREEAESRIRKGTIRDLSEWDDLSYVPSEAAGLLDIPKEIIPEGIEYQWCTCEVFSQPMTQHIAEYQRQGWRSVPAERHVGRWTPLGASGDIVVKGLLLMERPKSWCDRARAHDQANAQRQMAAKKAQFQGGDLPGVTLDAAHPSALRSNTMRSEFERIDVPKN